MLTDISDRHNGQEVWLSWAMPQASGRWQWVPSFGVNWKSGRAADYYYGVQKSEAQPGLPAHRVDAATNWFARLTASYSLDEHWKVVSVLQYEALADEISDSPSVVDDNVRTGFVGLYYEF